MPEDTHSHAAEGTFVFARRGAIRYLESTPLCAHDFLSHAFCTRWGGVSTGRLADLNFGAHVGDSDEDLRRNRERLRSAFDLPGDNPMTVHQVHGDRLLVIDRALHAGAGNGPLAYDGIITPLQGIAIGIKTADCVPLLIVDLQRHVIAAVHAGWQGTALGIAAKAIGVLIQTFASVPEDILVAIGPAIGPCCYEVDIPVFQGFDDTPVQRHAFTRGRGEGKWMLDLIAANRFQLQDAGIPRENILSADICTSCRHDLFFSHRGEAGDTGRQLSFIMLR